MTRGESRPVPVDPLDRGQARRRKRPGSSSTARCPISAASSSGRESADQLGGPIRIAQVSGPGRDAPASCALLHLAAVLSVSIGLLNLFPIPLLDGGHLLFYAIEAMRGRPLSRRAQEIGFRIGLAIVLMLMIFATYNDILHLCDFVTVASGNALIGKRRSDRRSTFARRRQKGGTNVGDSRFRRFVLQGAAGNKGRARCAWDFGCGYRGLALPAWSSVGTIVGGASRLSRDGGACRGADPQSRSWSRATAASKPTPIRSYFRVSPASGSTRQGR